MTEAPAPVALITGAGSGIGRAIAIHLAHEGHRLVLAGRRMGTLEETSSFLPPGTEAVCVPADVSDPASGHALVTTCLGRFGRLDVLINNAAMAPLRPIERTTADLIQETFFTNAIGPACTIAAAWLVFKRQHAEGRLGPMGQCIVNVSTLGTRDPFPGFFAYASSKAALNLMAHSCAKEGAEIGVRAFAVAPGAVADEVLACVMGERDAKNGQTIYLTLP